MLSGRTPLSPVPVYGKGNTPSKAKQREMLFHRHNLCHMLYEWGTTPTIFVGGNKENNMERKKICQIIYITER